MGVSLFCQCSGACSCSKPTYMPPKIIKDGYAAPGIAKAGKLDYFTGLPIAKGARVISFYDNCGELIGCVCAARKCAWLNDSVNVTTAPSNPAIPATNEFNAPCIFDPEGSATNPNGPTKIWMTMPDGRPKQIACYEDIPKELNFTARNDGCWAVSDKDGNPCIDNEKQPIIINKPFKFACLPDGRQQMVDKVTGAPFTDDKGNPLIFDDIGAIWNEQADGSICLINPRNNAQVLTQNTNKAVCIPAPKVYGTWDYPCPTSDGEDIYCDLVTGRIFAKPKDVSYIIQNSFKDVLQIDATLGTFDSNTNMGTIEQNVISIDIGNASCYPLTFCFDVSKNSLVETTTGSEMGSLGFLAVTNAGNTCFLTGLLGDAVSVTNDHGEYSTGLDIGKQASASSPFTAKVCFTLPPNSPTTTFDFLHLIQQRSPTRTLANSHPNFAALGVPPVANIYSELDICVTAFTNMDLVGPPC